MKQELIHSFFVSFILFSFCPVQVKAVSLIEGDRLYVQRANEAQARQGLAVYRDFLNNHPESNEARWKTSMALHFIGMRYEKDEATKQSLFREGKTIGEQSVAAEPHCAPCHFWTAINQALYGESVGVFKMFSSLGGIQEHLEQCAAIDPSYAMGGAYRILGLIERALPGILGGSNDRAIRYLEKAISVAPATPLNYLVLAKLWLEQMNDKEKAKVIREEGLSATPSLDEPIESTESRVELQILTSDPV